MAPVNNVTRLLDSKKIPYAAYELPPEKIGALEAAQMMGVEPELVFKTIVVMRAKGGKPILAIVPGPTEVDLKSLAEAAGEKKLALPTQKEAEQATGLLAGGISPLALINKGFQVFLDQSASQHEQIHISGGQRGLNIKLPVKALMDLTRARLAKIARPAGESISP